jgi:hypothetical protein
MTQPEIDFAAPEDDAAIRSLLRREPMPGRISVTFEREPDFWLGCKVTGDDCRVLVARQAGRSEIVGLACRSTRDVFINGAVRRLGYLGQLRVDSRYRGQWLVSRGFSKLKQLHDADPLPAYLVSIVDNNREATGVLVKHRRRGFPVFHAVADFRTLAIHVNRAKSESRGDIAIAPAHTNELADVARFLNLHGAARQFSSYWTEEALAQLSPLGLTAGDLRIARRDHQIVGIAGLWDQSSYKQTVVRAYSGWLKFMMPLYNKGAPFLGRRKLPRPCDQILSAYASPFCIANNDLFVCRALLRDLLNLAQSRGFHTLLIGLDANDPLMKAAREYSHVVYPSRIFLAEWPNGESIHEQLDRRPAYVDIATL